MKTFHKVKNILFAQTRWPESLIQKKTCDKGMKTSLPRREKEGERETGTTEGLRIQRSWAVYKAVIKTPRKERRTKQEERREKHDKPLKRRYETTPAPHPQCLGAPPMRSMLLIILLLEAIPEGLGTPLPILLCTGAEAAGASLNAGMEA